MSYACSGKARARCSCPALPPARLRGAALYKAGPAMANALRKGGGLLRGYDDLLVRKGQQGTHVGKYGIALLLLLRALRGARHRGAARGQRDAHRAELRRLIEHP